MMLSKIVAMMYTISFAEAASSFISSGGQNTAGNSDNAAVE